MTRTFSPVSSLSLLVSLISGPLVWFAHFALVWGVLEFGCHFHLNNVEIVNPANIRPFIMATTVIALVAIIISEALACCHWLTTRRERPSSWAFEDRHRVLTIDAMILNGFFLMGTLVTATPAFLLNLCVAGA